MNFAFLSCLAAWRTRSGTPWRTLSGPLRSGVRFAGCVPLGQPPSLHHLRGRCFDLVRQLRQNRYNEAVRLPLVVHLRSRVIVPFLFAAGGRHSSGDRRRISRFSRIEGSTPPQGLRPHRVRLSWLASAPCRPRCPRLGGEQRRHSGRHLISRLNTLPACAPPDASPTPLRAPAHGLGSPRVAKPFGVRLFHPLLHAGLSRRTPPTVLVGSHAGFRYRFLGWQPVACLRAAGPTAPPHPSPGRTRATGGVCDAFERVKYELGRGVDRECDLRRPRLRPSALRPPHSDLRTPISALRPPHSDLRFERRQRALMARAGVSRPRAVATASVGGDRRHRAHRMSAVNIPTSRWVIQAALA